MKPPARRKLITVDCRAITAARDAKRKPRGALPLTFIRGGLAGPLDRLHTLWEQEIQAFAEDQQRWARSITQQINSWIATRNPPVPVIWRIA